MSKILIATPAFNGQVTVKYMLSLLETLNKAHEDDLFCGIFTLANESLIPRGRNTCAAEFLNSEMKWDKLLFIDADISWSYEQFKSLVKSDKPLIGGAYPVKSLPISLNFKPLIQHEHYFKDTGKSLANFKTFVEHEGNDENEIPVELLPTGFLLIDRSILEHFTSKAPKYSVIDPKTGAEQHAWDFFRSGADNGTFLSEDWFFSKQCHKYGYQPYLKTNCIVNHEGSFVYGID